MKAALLCGILAVMGCLGFWLAWHYYHLHRGFIVVEIARDEIAQAGGDLTQGNVNGDFYIDLRNTYFDDEQFARLCEQLRQFPPKHLDQDHRIEIDASNTKITDASVKLLKGLPVMAVKIRGTNITDDSVPVLCSLPVWYLDLGETQITDKSVEDLSKLQLMILDVRDTQISNEGIERLSKVLPSHTQLHTSSSKNSNPPEAK